MDLRSSWGNQLIPIKERCDWEKPPNFNICYWLVTHPVTTAEYKAPSGGVWECCPTALCPGRKPCDYAWGDFKLDT